MAKHKLSKENDTILKNIASQLPVNKTGRISGSELLIENPYMKDGNGIPIDPKESYVLGKGMATNHYKRLRKAFINGGAESVNKYLAPFKQKQPVPNE